METRTNELPTRSEIEEKYTWRLEDIYASMEEWERDAASVKELSEKFSGFEGRLGESADTLLQALGLQEEIGQKMGKLFQFAKMHRDEDNTNPTYQALTDKARSLAVQLHAAESYFEPELLSLPEEKVRGFVRDNADLGVYAFMFEELFRQKPHVLSAAEEKLLAAAGEVTGAAQQIFTMFNNADMKFPTIRDEDGNEVELTHGRYSQFLESTNRDVRRSAFEALYETYGKHQNTLAATYSTSVKKDVFYANVRNYPSARDMYLDGDNVPPSVYDNLIDAVHEHLPALHKYLKLRKRVLKLDELHLYDLYTPIVGDVDFKIPYEEAVKTVKAAIAPLGETYQKIATEGMESGWIDVFETKGKTSGAYAWGPYGIHPFILLNYHDSLDNMFTLAHELGHAMHTYFSHENQPYVYSGYTIFVAEVASTCNEALLLDYLLKNTDDKRKRAYLINHQLETIRGTLYRQTMFAEFEKLTHEHVEKGEAVTREWMSDTYYRLNEQFFGAVCEVDSQIRMEWSRIPHFYTPFYVYKYATGISAATALAQKILSEGKDAVENYLGFLKGGSSKFPIELLRGAGVDMESPEPVKATLQLFSSLVDELDSLIGE